MLINIQFLYNFLLLPRDVRIVQNAVAQYCYGNVVCPSVCNIKVPLSNLSHQLNYFGSNVCIVYDRPSSPNSARNRGRVAIFSRKSAISLNQGNTGQRLLLITKEKLHMRCRLVPKSTTLDDDTERPLRTLFQNITVFFSMRQHGLLFLCRPS